MLLTDRVTANICLQVPPPTILELLQLSQSHIFLVCSKAFSSIYQVVLYSFFLFFVVVATQFFCNCQLAVFTPQNRQNRETQEAMQGWSRRVPTRCTMPKKFAQKK